MCQPLEPIREAIEHDIKGAIYYAERVAGLLATVGPSMQYVSFSMEMGIERLTEALARLRTA